MSLRYVGTDAPRPDAADKAAGRAVYIHDLSRPGMLYGKIKFSEHASARIKHIDTSQAERLPGVRAVITAYNTPELRIGFLRDNFALKKDQVRQFRDEIAAVAAIDPDIAAEAIELIQVEYEPLPGGLHAREARCAEGAPLVHDHDADGRPLTSNLLSVQVHHESGDLAAGERASKYVVEGEFSTPLIQQACMGTAGCIAEIDVRGNLTMWAKTQIPFLAQNDFVRALDDMGLGGRNARVIVPTLGGAFGTGLDTHAYEYIAILLAHRTGRPVKIVYDRARRVREPLAAPERQDPHRPGLRRRGAAHLPPRRGAAGQRRLHLVGGDLSDRDADPGHVALQSAERLVRRAAGLHQQHLLPGHARLRQPRGDLAHRVRLSTSSREKVGIDPLELRLLNSNEPGEKTPMGLDRSRPAACASASSSPRRASTGRTNAASSATSAAASASPRSSTWAARVASTAPTAAASS